MKKLLLAASIMMLCFNSWAAKTTRLIFKNPVSGNYDELVIIDIDPDGQMRFKDTSGADVLLDDLVNATPVLAPLQVKDFHLDVGIGADQISLDDIPDGVLNFHFTDERAQDAVGGILTNTPTVTLTYDDVLNQIRADTNESGLGSVANVLDTLVRRDNGDGGFSAGTVDLILLEVGDVESVQDFEVMLDTSASGNRFFVVRDSASNAILQIAEDGDLVLNNAASPMLRISNTGLTIFTAPAAPTGSNLILAPDQHLFAIKRDTGFGIDHAFTTGNHATPGVVFNLLMDDFDFQVGGDGVTALFYDGGTHAWTQTGDLDWNAGDMIADDLTGIWYFDAGIEIGPTGTLTTDDVLVNQQDSSTEFRRTSAATGGFEDLLEFVRESTGNSVDGFGFDFEFKYEDSANGLVPLARMSFDRTGIFNDGAYELFLNDGGVMTSFHVANPASGGIQTFRGNFVNFIGDSVPQFFFTNSSGGSTQIEMLSTGHSTTEITNIPTGLNTVMEFETVLIDVDDRSAFSFVVDTGDSIINGGDQSEYLRLDGIAEDVVFGEDLIPNGNNSHSLGATGARMDDIYIASSGATITGGIFIGDSGNDAQMRYDQTGPLFKFVDNNGLADIMEWRFEGEVTGFAGSILGTDDQRWDDLYVDASGIHVADDGAEAGGDEAVIGYDTVNNRLTVTVPTGGGLIIDDGTDTLALDPDTGVPITYFQDSASGATSTTSAAYVDVASMTRTFAAGEDGDWLVSFSSVGWGTVTGPDLEFTLSLNGTPVAHTERDMDFDGGGQASSVRRTMHTQAVIAVVATDTVAAQYRTNAGTFNVGPRSLIFTKLN